MSYWWWHSPPLGYPVCWSGKALISLSYSVRCHMKEYRRAFRTWWISVWLKQYSQICAAKDLLLCGMREDTKIRISVELKKYGATYLIAWTCSKISHYRDSPPAIASELPFLIMSFKDGIAYILSLTNHTSPTAFLFHSLHLAILAVLWW